MTRYKLDGTNFPIDPIDKAPTRQQIAQSGVGESIYTNFWQYELNFPTLKTRTELDFFMGKWLAGGLHTMVLPHPVTGNMTGFTGCNIAEFAYRFMDVEQDGWAASARMLVNHVSLSATGTV